MLTPAMTPPALRSSIRVWCQRYALASGLSLTIWLSCSLCMASSGTPGYAIAPRDDKTADFSLALDSDHRFKADIDNGGDLEQTRFRLSGWALQTLNEQWEVAINATYSYHRYNFSGGAGFGQLNPWEHINLLTVTVPVIYQPSREWRFTYAPLVQLSVETRSDIGRSVSGGGVATMEYRFNEHFALGILLGGTTSLEEGGALVLLPLFSWHITEGLHFEGRLRDGLPAYLIELSYETASSWRIGLGIETENHRFRLDNSGSAPDGIGEVSAGTLRVSVAYRLEKALRLELYSGISGGDLKLEDKNGKTIRQKDVDLAPLVGFSVKGIF